MSAERRPWEVQHVSTRHAGPLAVLPGSAGAYVVVWDGDRPLGAVSVGADELPVTVAAILPRIGPTPFAPASRRPPGVQPCTVVVCTRGRAASLARCLDALQALDPPPAAVVVVDNGPDDPAVRALVADRPDVRYVAEPRPGLDIARNTGWRHADTPLVAYTDDDVVVHRGWIGALVAAFDRPDVVAVTGLVLPASLETRAQQIFERHWSFNKGFAARDFGPDFYEATRARGAPAWEIGAGANMAFRRSYLEATGGFDERLDVGAAGCSGDSEMWYRVLAEGLTCRYVPDAVCHHEHRRDLPALQGQLRAYMRGHMAALLVQYSRYGERGNLRRAFGVLPAHYARTAVRRLLRRVDPDLAMSLGSEVAGSVSGVVFCLRDREWRAAVRSRVRPAP